MKRNFTVFRMSLVLLMGFFIVFSTNAQSKKLSIQGYLKDGNGKAVDNGNYPITFKIYDVATGGTEFWKEDNSAVNVYGGIYTVQLGSITDISTLAWDKPYFLGVSISGTELSPRTELTYAPYAFAVNKATLADLATTVKCSGALGDVKYSILNPTQFATVNGDCWVAMRGQSIAGSKLAILSGINTLTDASGLFLRGQEFPGGTDNDPNRDANTTIATVQGDDNKSHAHTGTTSQNGDHTHTVTDTYMTQQENAWCRCSSGGSYTGYIVEKTQTTAAAGNHNHTLNINSSGGSESRPKNLNLWTYIRTN